ncbi:probable 39S ribosomal protein L49, mitochondrial [Hylaeus anthracinus]|uniref:probable 39S ribosomal protein L49, mitochondrial n=1 Tax=Hylaeus anthracinus TaxID=313031 RepID=UPI0023BA0437|nr:probable 39S ribosomal protein L49, mitochondrial [Hylaeus anthracinus]
MAALRLFMRSKLSAIILRSTAQFQLNNVSPIVCQIDKRWGSYKSSPVYNETEQYPDYEISNDPREWEYVTRLLPPTVVPVPPLEEKVLPSGWKPPTVKPGTYPYHIQRSKNYMQSVYLSITFRGMRRQTIIRRIEGDIWQLESELRDYLTKETGRLLGVRINELVGEIRFRGDFVSLVKRWMDSKGF